MSFIVALVVTVALTSPFGDATASAIDDSDGLVIEVTLTYDGSAESIIARPYSDYQELPPTAMASQGNGTWIAWVELPTAQNWFMAFEAFPRDGTADLSEGWSLLDLGVDPIAIESDVVAPVPSKPLIPDGSLWLIIAVAVGLSALGALTYWAFANDDKDERTEPDDSEAVE